MNSKHINSYYRLIQIRLSLLPSLLKVINLNLKSMNKKIYLTLIGLISLIYLNAQDCQFYYPEVKGAELIYKSFDKKGKLAGSTTSNVTEYNKTATGANAVIHSKSSDAKGKVISEGDLKVKCESGIFYFDMAGYLNQSASAYQGMDVKMETSNLEMPSKIAAGDKLKDGWVKMTVSNGAMKLLSMEITITERTIEKKESITTEAGTFDCYKINQTVITKVPMTYSSKSSEWLSPGTGLIKSESYASDGSIASSLQLSSIKK